MCFHSQQTKSATQLEHRFKAKFSEIDKFHPGIYNGFQHPDTPVITNREPQSIELFQWGLIPFWAKDKSIQKNTLNARLETIHEKPSFKHSLENRCLILADGFYEWQWLDPKGKQKQKYLITLPDESPFAFAGLYNNWVDKETGEMINTYTIITTVANELMSRIHNTKKRMPVILYPEQESQWLQEGLDLFTDVELKAVEV